MKPAMAKPDSQRRNVLVILCDQLRKDFLPAYGCEAIQTPAIDRLAAMGVTFDRAITMPVCAPARATMMTGRYPSDHGVWSNDIPFRPGVDFVADRMNALGYRTGCFGKLHHAPADDVKCFQVHRQVEEGRLGERDDYLKWLRQRHPEAKQFNLKPGRYEFAFDEEEHCEHWIASEAIAFLNDSDPRPSFTWVSFQGPHDPLDPPASVVGSCDTSKLPTPVPTQELEVDVHATRRCILGLRHDDPNILARRTAYAESIVFIDRQIGRILDALETSGRLEHTTILFAADHGDMLGDLDLVEKGPFPFPAQLEVPMILANQNTVESGVRTDTLVNVIDIPGTAIDIGGDERGIGMAESLVDLASGKSERRRSINFSEFCNAFKLVEDQRYRYACYPFTSQRQLFDLESDPFCLENLADQPEQASRVAEMERRVLDFACLTNGVRVEAHDLVMAQQETLERLWPRYAEEMPIMFPLTAAQRDALAAAGLPAEMNRVFETRTPTRRYQPAYWEKTSS
ncbi:MAG: sulfatase-like hydrolase/transferase [Planctomycetota bacterium]